MLTWNIRIKTSYLGILTWQITFYYVCLVPYLLLFSCWFFKWIFSLISGAGIWNSLLKNYARGCIQVSSRRKTLLWVSGDIGMKGNEITISIRRMPESFCGVSSSIILTRVAKRWSIADKIQILGKSARCATS